MKAYSSAYHGEGESMSSPFLESEQWERSYLEESAPLSESENPIPVGESVSKVGHDEEATEFEDHELHDHELDGDDYGFVDYESHGHEFEAEDHELHECECHDHEFEDDEFDDHELHADELDDVEESEVDEFGEDGVASTYDDESTEPEGYDEYELLNLMFEVEDTCSCREQEVDPDFEGQVRKRRARRRRFRSRRRRISRATEDKKRKSAVDRPYRWVCRLVMEFPSGDTALGSGVLIGPAHVLTAAHNVRQLNENTGVLENASRVEVIPAYDLRRPKGKKAIFDVAETLPIPEPSRKSAPSQSFVPQELVIEKNDDGNTVRTDDWDVAVLKLTRSLGTKNFPTFERRVFRPLEFWGFRELDELKSVDPSRLGAMAIHMAGYPAEDPRSGDVMIVSEGRLDAKKQKGHSTKTNNFFHTIRTLKGDSGSPIWREIPSGRKDPIFQLIGIHSGLGKNRRQRIGVAVTEDVLRKIAVWDPETFRFEKGRLSVIGLDRPKGPNKTIRDICGDP